MMAATRRRLISGSVLLLLALTLWGYVVGPMVATFQQSISGDDGAFSAYGRFFDFGNGRQGQAMLGSLAISLLSVIFAGITGTFLAVLLNRWDFPLRRLCQVLVLVPIALPPVIGVQAFVHLYGLGGTIPQVLGWLFHADAADFALKRWAGVLLVHTLTMYPLFYLSVAAALSQTDDSLEEAAYSLGASRFDAWKRVLLPMLTPAIVAGALLTFMSSMASYTAPLLFQVDQVMTQQIAIASEVKNDLRFASVVSVILAAMSIGFLILLRAYERRSIYRTQSKGGARRRRRVTGPFATLIVFAMALISIVVIILPIAMIFLMAFAVNGSWTHIAPLPSRYTTQNFVQLFSDPGSWKPIRNSLQMSAIAVIGALLLGVSAAYVTARGPFRAKGVIDVAMMLPWALPGTVVAINLITAFANPSVFSFGQALVGTYWILPLAYFVRFSPLVFRSTTASLAQLDPAMEEAALSLGASWWYSFRRVVLPLLSRGILAGALLAFVDGVGEFVASILLHKPRYMPLSVAIYRFLNSSYGTAAALGVVQVLLILVVVIMTARLENRSNLFGIR